MEWSPAQVRGRISGYGEWQRNHSIVRNEDDTVVPSAQLLRSITVVWLRSCIDIGVECAYAAFFEGIYLA